MFMLYRALKEYLVGEERLVAALGEVLTFLEHQIAV